MEDLLSRNEILSKWIIHSRVFKPHIMILNLTLKNRSNEIISETFPLQSLGSIFPNQDICVLVVQSCSIFCNSIDYSLPGSFRSMEFSRHEYWRGLPYPSPGDLPDPGIEPRCHTLQADFFFFLPFELPSKSLAEGNFYFSLKFNNKISLQSCLLSSAQTIIHLNLRELPET